MNIYYMICEKTILFDKDEIINIINSRLHNCEMSNNDIDYGQFIWDILDAITIVQSEFNEDDVLDYFKNVEFFENHK
jgi:hypothetical protein